MKFRLFLLALLLSFCIVFSGCTGIQKPPENSVNELDETNTVQPVSDYVLETVEVKDAYGVSYDYAMVEEHPVSDLYPAAELTQGYKSLTEEGQRDLYSEMQENVYYIAQEPEDGMYDVLEIRIWGAELSEAQIRQVIVAFSLDNPHVFWLDNKFGYSNTNGSTVLQLYSFVNADTIEKKCEVMNSEIIRLQEGLLADMTEYSREIYVHDFLVNNCTYAEDVFKISDDFLSFTSYGAISGKRAVCEGYSRGLQLLLSSVGIESFPVVGNGNDGLHMWTCAKIDNEWYYVDATWNDTEKGIGYDYFNLTTEQILYDHTIMPIYSQLTEDQICGVDDGVADSFNLIVPICSATSQNYFVKNSLLVNDLGDISKENIKTGLRVAQASLTEKITISISTSLDFEETLDSLFYSGDYIFFECLDAVNDELESDFLDRNNVSISKKPHLRVVTVLLQYTDER